MIVMPETQSQEKKDVLRVCGADLQLVPAVPYRDPNNYVRYSERLANELAETTPEGVIWANQFDNVATGTAISPQPVMNSGTRQRDVLKALSVLWVQAAH